MRGGNSQGAGAAGEFDETLSIGDEDLGPDGGAG